MSKKRQSDNVTKRERGNSLCYALRRLAEARPDLHQRVVAGELTAHAAMLEAGLRERSFTVPQNPSRAAQILVRNFSSEDLRTLHRHLHRALLPEPDRDLGQRTGTPNGRNGRRRTYYAFVNGEEISKHFTASTAFRALDKLVQECTKRGEPTPEVWIQEERGSYHF